MNLPERFIRNMKDLLGEDYPAWRDSLQCVPNTGIRVNELKISKEDFQILWKKCGGGELKSIPWIHNGFFTEDTSEMSGHPLYQAGLFYIQEPSAMTPAENLPVSEGNYVLDLCAAPGGKSTELLAKLNGTGVLYSNDISASRAAALRKNLELAGAANAFVTAESPDKLAGCFPGYFDRILVDAPCSGEGMFRREPGMTAYWEEKDPAYYAKIQEEILEKAVSMLKCGGFLMYSTCTFSVMENEANVMKVLMRHPEMELCDIKDQEGFAHGVLPGSEKCVRIYPHRMRGEGQFLALFKKKETGHVSCADKDQSSDDCQKSYPINSKSADAIHGRKLNESEAADMRQGIKLTVSEAADMRQGKKLTVSEAADMRQGIKLTVSEAADMRQSQRPVKREIFEKNGEIYLVPGGVRPYSNLRYLMTGLHVGTIKRDRLEPSQALAEVLRQGEWTKCLNLASDDPRTDKYLRGETISADEEEILICDPQPVKAAGTYDLASLFRDVSGSAAPAHGQTQKPAKGGRDLHTYDTGAARMSRKSGSADDFGGTSRGRKNRSGEEFAETSRGRKMKGEYSGASRKKSKTDETAYEKDILILIEGHPVGFGAYALGRIKNKRSPGRRIM